MAGVPHRLQPDTDYPQNLALINDNFDKVVQDLRDLGGSLSTTLTFNTGSMAAGTLSGFTVALLAPNMTAGYSRIVRTQSNITAISNSGTLTDFYVDTDNTPATKWPDGSSVVLDSQFFSVVTGADRPSDALALYFIQVNNRDSIAHTYYVHFRVAYFKQGVTGVFR